MRLPPVVLGIVAVLVTATCLSAGFWQLSRRHAKQVLNARRREALALPAGPMAPTLGEQRRQVGRKVVVSGAYDTARHVLLSARFHDGELGVELLTPMLTTSAGSVLVNRGWLRSEDGVNADLASLPDPGSARVVGLLEPIAVRAGSPPWRRLGGDRGECWSTHELDSAAVAGHVPYALAPFVLVALPDSGAPEPPVRSGPPQLDEQMHLSYAIQWFAFALATAWGSLHLAIRRGREGRKGRAPGG